MKIKDSDVTVVSRITTVLIIPIISAAYATYFISLDVITSFDILKAVLVVIVAGLLIANLRYLDVKYRSLLLYFKHKDLAYGYIKITLEYLDREGKRVAMKREDYVSNISLKNKTLHPFPLEAEGGFVKQDTSAVNGTFSFPSNQKVLFVSNLENRVNNGVSFFSTVIKNSFLKQTEDMTFYTKNFCKLYKLEIKIPNSIRILDAKLLHRERQTPNQSNQTASNEIINQQSVNWVEVTEGRILKNIHLENTSLVTYVENLHPDEEYKLVWTVNQLEVPAP